jgi:hypothetical protein
MAAILKTRVSVEVNGRFTTVNHMLNDISICQPEELSVADATVRRSVSKSY